jgi:hypothetical protein
VIAGTYSFVYCGAKDVGIGQFIIGQDGGFVGADLGGVIYTGIARENDVGWITLDIQLTIPAGTTLVQGTAVQDVPHTNSIHAFLPPDFGDGHPQQIQAALGVVTIMVKRVPEGTAFPPAATPVHRIGEG